jgi:glutaredoxin
MELYANSMEKYKTNAENTLIIYGHHYCSQATLLRSTMDQHNIPYEWRDIRDGDPVFKEELKAIANGNLSVPTVILPSGVILIEPLPRYVLKLVKPAGGFLAKLADFFNPQPD